MLNQVVLVGRLTKDLEIFKTESGKKMTNLVLAVPRSFKNMDGVYETDFIECKLYDQVACNTAEYCYKGDIVAIRGRLQSRKYETEDKKNRQVLEVIVEKVTFLSGKHEETDK